MCVTADGLRRTASTIVGAAARSRADACSGLGFSPAAAVCRTRTGVGPSTPIRVSRSCAIATRNFYSTVISARGVAGIAVIAGRVVIRANWRAIASAIGTPILALRYKPTCTAVKFRIPLPQIASRAIPFAFNGTASRLRGSRRPKSR